MKKDYWQKDKWVHYIVDTNEDYYFKEIPLQKLPLDKMSIQLTYMLQNYQTKLLYVKDKVPQIYPMVLAQFKDFYFHCIDLVASKMEQLDSEVYNVREILEKNLIDCCGTLKDRRDEMLWDIDNKYELQMPKSFKVGEYLKKQEVAEFHDRVMAQLVCLFPNMKNALSKEYIIHFKNINDIQNTLENARLMEKLNEYAITYDKALRYEDMHSVLDNYAYRFQIMKLSENNNIYPYNPNMMNRAFTSQIYIEEEKQTNNVLITLMHLIVDYDFLSMANKQNTVIFKNFYSLLCKHLIILILTLKILKTILFFGNLIE